MKGQKQESARKIALFVIMETLEHGKKLNEALLCQQEIYQYLPKMERAFLNRLSRGCVERCCQLDYIINLYSDRKTDKMKPVIRNILRMGAYEILFMEKVPDRAACNEAVGLARQKGFSGLSGFVNGVLRTIARNKEKIPYPPCTDKASNEKECDEEFIKYMESLYSLPGWLTGFWCRSYGRQAVEKMAGDFLKEKKTTLRVNTLKISAEELREKLTRSGIEAKPGIYSPYALIISGYDHIAAVEGYREGWFQIQDESSMLAVAASGIEERIRNLKNIRENKDESFIKVLDVCGAPGGKGLFYAQLLEGSGWVNIRDISQKKLMIVEENAKRLGLSSISLEIKDAAASEGKDCFDIVSADLPCSGLGVIGRKCDIKYRVRMEDIRELSLLQRRILKQCRNYVKPGGVLIYSTCTVSPVENEENAEWFLEEFPDFKPYDIGKHLPESLNPHFILRSANGEEIPYSLQLLPGLHQADGFFIAGFEKKI